MKKIYLLLILLIIIGLIASAYAGLSMYEEQIANNENENCNNPINNDNTNQKYSASSDPEDEEGCRQILNPCAAEMFEEIDENNDGYLSQDELNNYFNYGTFNNGKSFTRGMTYEEFKNMHETFEKINTEFDAVLTIDELNNYYKKDNITFNQSMTYEDFLKAW